MTNTHPYNVFFICSDIHTTFNILTRLALHTLYTMFMNIFGFFHGDTVYTIHLLFDLHILFTHLSMV